jgi:hypothetical protein
MSFQVQGDQVTYYQNGALIYTAQSQPQFPVRIYTVGAVDDIVYECLGCTPPPTPHPSPAPTAAPSPAPTSPTDAPTFVPTKNPTTSPTETPTAAPTSLLYQVEAVFSGSLLQSNAHIHCNCTHLKKSLATHLNVSKSWIACSVSPSSENFVFDVKVLTGTFGSAQQLSIILKALQDSDSFLADISAKDVYISQMRISPASQIHAHTAHGNATDLINASHTLISEGAILKAATAGGVLSLGSAAYAIHLKIQNGEAIKCMTMVFKSFIILLGGVDFITDCLFAAQ